MKLPIVKSILILASLLQFSTAFAQIKPRPRDGGRNEERDRDRDPRPGRPDPIRPDRPERPDPYPDRPRPERPRPDPIRPDRPHRPDPIRPRPDRPRPDRPRPRPDHPRPWPDHPRPRPDYPDYPRPIPPPHSSYGEETVSFVGITRRTGGEWLRVGFYSPAYVDYIRVNLYNAGLMIHEAYVVTTSGRRLMIRELSNRGVYYAVDSISSEYISAGERITAIDIRAEGMGGYADITVTVESNSGDLSIYPYRP